MSVVLIDYGAGNLRSVAKALEAAGAGRVTVSSDARDVLATDRVVLPGVGAFGHCAASLRAVPGMVEALEETVRHRRRPFLGICVGMQLLADRGLEYGDHSGLGWIAGEVRRLEPDAGLKVPQIGWNLVEAHDPLFEAGYAYFVHSYAFHADDRSDVAASVDYGGDVIAAVARDNIVGVQFHPEKSQAYGLDFLRHWLSRKI